MNERTMLTTKEAAEALAISRGTLYRLLKEGVIGHVSLGGGSGRMRIPKAQIDVYLGARTTFGRPKSAPERTELCRKAAKARVEKMGAPKPISAAKTIIEEQSIYNLNLKPRTFNVLHNAGMLLIDDVDVENPDIAKKLLSIPKFGWKAYEDLKQALIVYKGGEKTNGKGAE